MARFLWTTVYCRVRGPSVGTCGVHAVVSGVDLFGGEPVSERRTVCRRCHRGGASRRPGGQLASAGGPQVLRQPLYLPIWLLRRTLPARQVQTILSTLDLDEASLISTHLKRTVLLAICRPSGCTVASSSSSSSAASVTALR